MGFAIHYRSTESMHPAQAFEIKQYAERLIQRYLWASCEPVLLQQRSDGHLAGQSKPVFFPAEVNGGTKDLDGLSDGTVMTVAEVLGVLSREYGVDWEIGHDYEPDPIGLICDGVVDDELMEQLETFGSIGDLLEDISDEEAAGWESAEYRCAREADTPRDRDDEEPRVLKFPGTE
jgi:hypothetical protein